MLPEKLIIRGAREHNLKNINLELPRNKFIVITGLSGSGKTSLAFDTIYAEGQRRYVESLSAYARQFLGLMEKPDVDSIEGLSPAISIEQKSASRNPRSTVGTVTEIHDYLRLLFARVGHPNCYNCGRPISRQSVQQIVDSILNLQENAHIQVLSPLVRGRKGEFKEIFKEIKREGFVRVRLDGKIYEIGQFPDIDKKKNHNVEVVVDRLVIRDDIKERLTDSVELALKHGSGKVIIDVVGEEERIFSEHYACPYCEISYPDLEPRLFSFNSPFGACSECDGLGTKTAIDEDLIVPDKRKSLMQGAVVPLGEQPRGSWYAAILKSLAKHYGFSFTKPWKDLSPEAQHAIIYGTEGEKIKMQYESKTFKGEYDGTWEGVVQNLQRRYSQTTSPGIRNWIESFMSSHKCAHCAGTRLRVEARHVFIGGKSVAQLSDMTIRELLHFFENLDLTETEEQIGYQVLKEIRSRLRFLNNVGLNYLTLSRTASTLSGGEAQRIRLATQIGSQLVGVLYILDEPSIGLHQRDNHRLIDTLMNLRDLGNTVLVIEHDQETMEEADLLVDMGPGAGEHGGYVVAVDTPEGIKTHPKSITGQYLSGKLQIEIPEKRRKGKKRSVTITGARGNNLQKISVELPLGKFVCVTGVSGSGKSSLINQTLYPAMARALFGSKLVPLSYESVDGLAYVDKVVDIDQSPIGRTPRSNPATYTGSFTFIRDLFANLPESRLRGYKPGRFSFNVKGGRCESCQGDGIIKIEMHFLPDVYVKCEVCNGKRYNRETLEIVYKGKNIAQVLDMSVEEAAGFFLAIPGLKRKLKTLVDVGLGYIKLGQQATTLSGGEAQRVKLASELSRVGTGNTFYILDEPTTGLHFDDVKMLLNVLNRLVNKGNTVLVIEHNLDVIKSADYIIDLGPEGGDQGGKIIATGTPEAVARNEASYTGQYLKQMLEKQSRLKNAGKVAS
ncbi:MAG: excinuclease ABC subunit UvrA [Candidatus Marinimicrobia bacterium]|nr:excinuclease ABC subunit UvrA [Candidatus Neomarinimicrobiota bacterium]